ncbi:MAG: diadenylate cyclase CdaA [Chloroflexi bacterium]|nr:diadenylate cyclase CdaA [Chloroflexota bacterium]
MLTRVDGAPKLVGVGRHRGAVTDILWIVQRLNVRAVADILLVAVVFFLLLLLVRATQAVSLLRGLLVLAALSLLLGTSSQLPLFGVVVRTAIPALLVGIPVIFQPELRRALERLGRFNEVIASPRRGDFEVMVHRIAEAAQRLAVKRHGALIVIERETGLQDLVETGVKIDAGITPELLATIFFPNSPLHDGGVIVRDMRIAAAGCVLPLTATQFEDVRFGLRHRAGIGVTEGTDAIAVIVSEEHGMISIAHNGRMIRGVDPAQVVSALLALTQPSLARATSGLWLPSWLRGRGP